MLLLKQYKENTMKKGLKLGLVILLFSMCQWSTASTRVGDKAPDFTLPNAEGKPVKLSDYANQFIVLEWSNFDCPFVKKHYSSKNIPTMQQKFKGKNVAWITILSSAEGKQGYYTPEQLKEKIASSGNQATQVLQDSSGTVGKRYGAKTTPQFVIINPKGIIEYTGAIDSIPSTDAADIVKADKYVNNALSALLNDKPVLVQNSQPYGCGVKYSR
jgi:AhpC/TSA family